MSPNVLSVITAIDRVTAKDLDECSVGELALLQFALHRNTGAIFVKTVGRMAGACDSRPSMHTNGFASVQHQTDGEVL